MKTHFGQISLLVAFILRSVTTLQAETKNKKIPGEISFSIMVEGEIACVNLVPEKNKISGIVESSEGPKEFRL